MCMVKGFVNNSVANSKKYICMAYGVIAAGFKGYGAARVGTGAAYWKAAHSNIFVGCIPLKSATFNQVYHFKY